ncbi:hypothetical protein UFOVP823_37 [uncultured Caudovirales phage]|uniref:Uncharacterized protein n=1 Tax=uncultured Caudovirales phage TaxID=2100421 RepID=A0A6J5P5Y0_9CAUD|nr:hypothetical protein UFOVP823_37 [uncultured Caudovirales phage]
MIDFNDPTMMALLNAGVIDVNGNYLIDPSTGQPVQQASVQPDFAQLDRDYTAAKNASGMSDDQWKASNEYASWQGKALQARATTTDKDFLTNQIADLNNRKDDPTYGTWYAQLASAEQSRLDFLNNPLAQYLIPNNGGHTTRTEGQINAGTQDIYNQANSAFSSLLDFQRQQAAYTTQLADEIRMQREFAIPRPPEHSGTFVAGGTALAKNATRVGIPDLLIRY